MQFEGEAARIAIAENSGLPAFNVFGYGDAAAVISAAERMNRPVVLMTNKVAVAHMGIPVLAEMLLRWPGGPRCPPACTWTTPRSWRTSARRWTAATRP